jgi:hypothetical protein
MDGNVMPTEVSHPWSLTPKGEEQVLGLDSLVARDDGGMTRSF